MKNDAVFCINIDVQRKSIYKTTSKQPSDIEKDINMSYHAQDIAKRLQAARRTKGVSQRELSAFAGIPQAQISRIEAGTVDLRLSSLVALAHALDLELELIPRKAVPAVRSLSREAIHSSAHDIEDAAPRPAYSLDEEDDDV